MINMPMFITTLYLNEEEYQRLLPRKTEIMKDAREYIKKKYEIKSKRGE